MADPLIAGRTSESLWTRAQYRLLRRLAPTEPTHMSGGAYKGHSKLRVLLGDALVEKARGKDVVDFGCGIGTEAIELATVARSVVGVDTNLSLLARARTRAIDAGVADRCSFTPAAPPGTFDVIVSLDSFEHFGDPAAILESMSDLMRPGGQAVISFGPTWYHPYGGHLFSVFPWAHLLFSEAALMRWRNDLRSDGATRFGEVEGGLNQMTIKRFERLVQGSPLRLRHLETVPIRAAARFHSRFTREFTTAIVRCILERTASPREARSVITKLRSSS
jgi:SAM-dependent methyltransferase